MCNVLLPPGVNQIAVNKQIIVTTLKLTEIKTPPMQQEVML
jgi:hypothetical protein